MRIQTRSFHTDHRRLAASFLPPGATRSQEQRPSKDPCLAPWKSWLIAGWIAIVGGCWVGAMLDVF